MAEGGGIRPLRPCQREQGVIFAMLVLLLVRATFPVVFVQALSSSYNLAVAHILLIVLCLLLVSLSVLFIVAIRVLLSLPEVCLVCATD